MNLLPASGEWFTANRKLLNGSHELPFGGNMYSAYNSE